MASVAMIAAVAEGAEWSVAQQGSRCGCCGLSGADVPAGSVISRNFTGFDEWADPGAEVICRGCAWGFTAPDGRTAMRVVRRDPVGMAVLSPAGVRELLVCGPLPAGWALVVPLRPGRKHLLSQARWGVVTVDDARLPWGSAEVARMRVAVRLRRLGISAAALSAAAAPFGQVQGLTALARLEVLTLWPQLQIWREDGSPWMRLVQRVTGEMAVAA